MLIRKATEKPKPRKKTAPTFASKLRRLDSKKKRGQSKRLRGSGIDSEQTYQLSLAAPPAPVGSFDPAAAQRGKSVFNGGGTCVTCHSGAEFTDANFQLHPVSDVVSEPEPSGVPSWASRSATKKYRTSPLAGIWQHAPYFHNGSAPTLEAVVQTYNTRKSLGLTDAEIKDLTEYLKSL